jgi:3-isopropylmalate/(R)-2-methylmalate dehydratase small subunit
MTVAQSATLAPRSRATCIAGVNNQQSAIIGRVWKYGDGVNTDVIFPGKYTYSLKEPDEIAAHALEDLDPAFATGAQPGDVIVAGRNWGNGSSREQAVTALKYKGIAAVVARSFARIYFRNGINQGLLLITCPAAVDAAQAGDTIEIDLERNVIRLWANTEPQPSTPTPLRCGGHGALHSAHALPAERGRAERDAREFSFPPLSATALSIINAGGLVPHIRKKLGLTSTEVVPTGNE